MRQFLLIVALLGIPSVGSAVELVGRYGYAGEWAVTVTLPDQGQNVRSSATGGQLHLKHLAMCGPGEVSEKTGSISFQRFGRRYAATLQIADDRCVASGVLSEESVAFANCDKAGQIPLRLWLR